RGGAVAVTDHHIVAVGVVVGGGGHHAALGGQNTGAAGGRDVDARGVLRLAGDGVDAPRKQRGQVIISRQRPHKTGFADHVVDLGGQLPLGGGNLRVGGVGGGLEFGLLRLQLVLLSGQLVDEGAHLRLLRFQV